jgi:hypothetical protein
LFGIERSDWVAAFAIFDAACHRAGRLIPERFEEKEQLYVHPITPEDSGARQASQL